jgi:superfamily I DNA/RNA helicase
LDDQDAPGVRLATMHRVKGLEFDKMVVAGLSDKNYPRRNVTEDDTVREDEERADRSLLYVALTRARSQALVTANGHLSSLVKVS